MAKQGVNYDGDQSEKLAKITGNSAGSGNGIKFNNTQLVEGDDSKWEKQQGVSISHTGNYSDKDADDAYSVDLSKNVKCVGMKGSDCYGT